MAEQVKPHTNWCVFYDYNPREVHLNFAQNLVITTRFIGCILLPNFRVDFARIFRHDIELDADISRDFGIN